MLSRHAHSALTASDARDARARQCADRMEVGRRARRDALLRSADARRDQNGAFGRPNRDCFTAALDTKAFASTIRARRPVVRHACDHDALAGRVDREYRWPRSSERTARAVPAAGAQSSCLLRWAAPRRGLTECDVVLLDGSGSWRTHVAGGRDRQQRCAPPEQRYRYVLCAADIVDRESTCRSCAAQSAPPSCKQQNAREAAVVCRFRRSPYRQGRPAHEPSAEKALAERAFTSRRASMRDDLPHSDLARL